MAHIDVTKNNFEALVEQAAQPVLLDFWAPWCGPCRMVAPILEEISLERPDVTIAKVNVDNEPELAQRFGIVSIPTLIVMNGGLEAERAVGYRPKESILSLLP